MWFVYSHRNVNKNVSYEKINIMHVIRQNVSFVFPTLIVEIERLFFEFQTFLFEFQRFNFEIQRIKLEIRRIKLEIRRIKLEI